VSWSAKDQKLHCQDKSAEVPLENGLLKLRILRDRTSIEVFAAGGTVYMPSCFVPKPGSTQTRVIANGGDVRVASMKVRELKSSWE
jgi:fructan beta-fructosidase